MKNKIDIENNFYGTRTFPAAEIIKEEDFRGDEKIKKDIEFWTDEEIQELKKIHETFKFGDFDLKKKFLEGVNLAKGLGCFTKSNPGYKEKIQIKLSIWERANELSDAISLSKIGIDITKEISAHINLDELIEILAKLQLACYSSVLTNPSKRYGSLPKNDETKNKKGFKHDILLYLRNIFIEGSSLEPTLYTDNYSISEKHKGNLYEFMISIKPLFEKKSGIKLGKNSTIAGYLFEMASI